MWVTSDRYLTAIQRCLAHNLAPTYKPSVNPDGSFSIVGNLQESGSKMQLT
jgi:hypothetical protein